MWSVKESANTWTPLSPNPILVKHIFLSGASGSNRTTSPPLLAAVIANKMGFSREHFFWARKVKWLGDIANTHVAGNLRDALFDSFLLQLGGEGVHAVISAAPYLYKTLKSIHAKAALIKLEHRFTNPHLKWFLKLGWTTPLLFGFQHSHINYHA